MKKFLFLFLLISITVQAQKGDTYFATKNGALDGYDVVAYFTEHKPKQGKKEFAYVYQGVNWQFANAEHLQLFKKSPEKYLPEFGGFCAYGVSKGYKVKIDPNAWEIVNGKLYLNYDLSVQQTWQKDKPGYINEANKNWIKLKEQ